MTLGTQTTDIQKSAFGGNTNLKTINFPETLKTIGNSAFADCKNLAEVNLNEGLETIGEAAFKGVAFGEKLSNGSYSHKSLTIPSTVQSIGYQAFYGCTYLEKVEFLNGETEVLTLENIWGNAETFAGCENLEEVILPERLKSISVGAFGACEKLETVTLGTQTADIQERAFRGNTNLKTINFPETLKTIGNSAFADCKNLAEVNLNEGLETIGEAAFKGVAFGEKQSNGSYSHETLTIPSTVQSIGYQAFYGCTYLEKVEFLNGETEVLTLENIWGNAETFAGCENLEEVILPERLKSISVGAFGACEKLETVTLGTQTADIQERAFRGNTNLKTINFPETLKTIGNSAFENCAGLAKVNLNEGLETIGEAAFRGVAFGEKQSNGSYSHETLTIPSTVQSIGSKAFYGCTYLEKVEFLNGETEVLTLEIIWGNAETFAGCENLEEVILPERLKSISVGAFGACEKLETVTLGTQTADIQERAFRGNTNLKMINFPETLKTIGNSAFAYCKNLAEVNLNEGLETIGNDAFKEVAFGRKLSNGSYSYGTLTIPSTVQSIGSKAFYGCTYLEKVEFLNGNTVVLTLEGGYAETFAYCENLKEIYLPVRLEALPLWFVSGNEKLSILYIPETVTEINKDAVYNCPKITIYGVEGSAAEKFAKENNFKFKNKSSLPIFVTSVSLTPQRIIRSGEDAIGTNIKLTARIMPSTAMNKLVHYTSSDENVVTVSTEGIATIKGYGEAVITVTTEDGGKEAQTTVSVLKEWTAEELTEVKNYITAYNDFQVITNVTENLKDITIQAPAGISAKWRLEYEPLTGSNASYDILLEKDGYVADVLENMEVTGITVTGLTVQSEPNMQTGKTQNVNVEVLTEGGNISEEDYEISWKVTSTAAAALTGEGQKTRQLTALKKISNLGVTATLMLKKDGNPTAKNKASEGITWFQKTSKINIFDEPLVEKITITADKKNQEVYEPIQLSDLKTLAKEEEDRVYRLNVELVGIDLNLLAKQDVPLTWKSSNTGVASIKTEKDGTVVLTVKKKVTGTATITAAATKNGGHTASFRIAIKDNTPRLEEKTVTLNLYQTNPSAVAHIVPSDGFEISTETLSVVTKGAGGAYEESAYNIVKTKGVGYEITLKDGTNVTTGKEKVYILAKTSANEEIPHELPLTIQKVKKAPSVSITQSAIDLYSKSGEGTVTIATNAEIESITYISSTATDKVRLVQKDTDVKKGTFTYTCENANNSNYKKAANKGTLQITFKDYVQTANYKKAITLKVNKNKPALTLKAESSVLYPATAFDSTKITLYEKATGNALTAASGYTIVPVTQSGYSLQPTEEGSVLVTAESGAKGKKLVFSVSNTDWYEGQSLSYSIKTAKTPTLSFEKNTVTLNKAYPLGAYNAVSVKAYVKGFDTAIKEIRITGKNAASKEAYEGGNISLEWNKDKIEAGIAAPAYFRKNSKLTYTVTAVTEKNAEVTGTLTISIIANESAKATATLKAAGKINLLDRQGTYITYTPTLKNYTDSVVKAELQGTNSKYFSVKLNNEDGKIYLYAKENASLNANKAYKVSMKLTLSSKATVVINNVSVTPKQVNPKITQNVTSTVLYETAAGETYGKEILFTPSGTDTIKIAAVELVNGGDTFCFEETEAGNGVLYVSPQASMKPGKTYTLKFAITFENAGKNVKPLYKTVKVKYCK